MLFKATSKDLSSWQKMLQTFLPIVAVLQLFVLGLIFTSFFARQFWWADLTSHFHVQYLLGSVLTLLFSLSVRAKKTVFLASLCALISLAVIGQSKDFLSDSNSQLINDSLTAPITLAHINYFYANHDFTGLDRLIDQHAPDIINFQESAPSHSKYIATEYRELYPHQWHHPRAGSYGLVIMSKLPITSSEIHEVDGGVFVNELHDLTFQMGEGQKFRLLSLHTAQPLSGKNWSAQRNNELAYTAKLIASHDREDVPLIMAGDLNITPYSPFFKDFIKATHYDYVGQGDILKGNSWPAKIPTSLFQIPIDHVFYNDRNAYINEWHAMTVQGSDHKALIVELQFLQDNAN